MARKTRGEQRFGAITYSQLAEWTGLQLSTVRSYGAKGLIPKHDITATIQWANKHRAKRDMPPIGILDRADSPEPLPTPQTGGYNPQTGDYS